MSPLIVGPSSARPAERKLAQMFRVAALCLPLILSACMTNRVQVTKETPRRQRQWAVLCRESAMLSAIVYRSEPGVDKAKLTRKQIEDEEARQRYEADLKADGWWRRGVCNRSSKGDGYGLYFEVWENDRKTPHRIVFAFRGTRSGPDWAANLRWIRFQKPRDHYLAAREECVPLIDRYYKEGGGKDPHKLIISTTGHSLGAGLAQEVLYADADKVDHCIAFDPSPITALHDLNSSVKNVYRQQPDRSNFSQYRIIRAYEKGEILMYARNIISLFHKPDTQTLSIEFDTPGRMTAVGKHSIKLLTEHVIKIEKEPLPAIPPAKWDKLTPALNPPTAYKED